MGDVALNTILLSANKEDDKLNVQYSVVALRFSYNISPFTWRADGVSQMSQSGDTEDVVSRQKFTCQFERN